MKDRHTFFENINIAGTKPYELIYPNNESKMVEDWKDLYFKMIEFIFDNNEKDFESKVKNIKGDYSYFSRNLEDFPEPVRENELYKEIKSSGLYVSTKFNPDSIRKNCRKLIEKFEYLDDEWKYTLEPEEPLSELMSNNGFEYDETVEVDSSFKNVWLLSPGENAKYWDEFKKENLIAISWGMLGNLSKYENNKEQLYKDFDKYYPISSKTSRTVDSNKTSKQTNNFKAIYDFYKEMNIGDLVFIKKGKNILLGVGEIVSDYIFSNETKAPNADYNHFRKVRWLKTGEFDIGSVGPMLIKTLTNITPYKSKEDNNLLFYQTLAKKMGFPIYDYVKNTNNGGISMKPGINLIYYGAPGTGKSYKVNKEFSNYKRLTFHPEYTYFDFVGGLKPVVLEDKTISYEFISGPFTNVLVEAYKNETSNVGLIIEEINRANTAAVFGDIFQLLDRDIEGKSEYPIDNIDLIKHLRKELEDDSISEIIIPPNFSIIATMNSADQGVFVMDSAFKRRWEFVYTPINFDSCSYGGKIIAGFDITWVEFGKLLNEELSNLGVSEDKLIGPYFLKEKDLDSKDKIASKLLIYLWDDVVRYKRSDLFTDKYYQFSEVVNALINGKNIFVKSLQEKLDNFKQNNINFNFNESNTEEPSQETIDFEDISTKNPNDNDL
jgi:hypothetical protein